MLKYVMAALAPLFLCSCLAGAAIGVAGDVVEAGVKTTGAVAGAVVGAAIPGDDEDEDDDDD